MSCHKIILFDPNKQKQISVQACLSNEIQWLWDLGINVITCNCGEKKNLGFIEVADENIEYMELLNYEHYIDKNSEYNIHNKFIPKTYKHIDESYFK